MLNTRLLRGILVLMTFLGACAPLLAGRPDPQALPSPSNDWRISLTQSGGFIGVMLKVEVSSDGQLKAEDLRSSRSVTRTLPAATLAKLAQLHSAALGLRAQSPHSGCADCFLYDLQINAGSKAVQIQADDTTLSESGAAELIGLLQQLRDDTLRSQP